MTESLQLTKAKNVIIAQKEKQLELKVREQRIFHGRLKVRGKPQ